MHEPRAANTHLRRCLRETPSLGHPQSFLLGGYPRPVPMPMQQQRGHTARPGRAGCPKPRFAVLRQNSRTRLRAKLRPRPPAATSIVPLRCADSTARREYSLAFFSRPWNASVSECVESMTSSSPALPMTRSNSLCMLTESFLKKAK